jgi:hypothetical protein
MFEARINGGLYKEKQKEKVERPERTVIVTIAT